MEALFPPVNLYFKKSRPSPSHDFLKKDPKDGGSVQIT